MEESNIIPCEKLFYGCELLMSPQKVKAINLYYIPPCLSHDDIDLQKIHLARQQRGDRPCAANALK
ncbi:MAG: hypothetical protein WA151_02725, partial [Desulfatirhabdiaceae bacterium]